MLPPDSRVVLTDQLRAPRGWRLDHAVATTFTLDLASALSAPLAFAAHQLPDVPDPLTVMEAVRGCVDRVDVFCQAGHITVRRADRRCSRSWSRCCIRSGSRGPDGCSTLRCGSFATPGRTALPRTGCSYSAAT